MSIKVDPKLLAAVVKALSITVPIRSARVMADGRVLVCTRDGQQVWEPPKKETAPPKAGQAPESVSKPRASRKRVAAAEKTGGKK